MCIAFLCKICELANWIPAAELVLGWDRFNGQGWFLFFFHSLQEFPPLLLPILRLLKELKSHLLKDPITWRRQKSSSSRRKEKDVWKILPVCCCCCWETSLKQLLGQQGITKETLSDAVHLSNFQTLPCNFSSLLASRVWNQIFSFDHEKLTPNLLLLTFFIIIIWKKKKFHSFELETEAEKDKYMVIVKTRGRKWVGLNSLKRFFFIIIFIFNYFLLLSVSISPWKVRFDLLPQTWKLFSGSNGTWDHTAGWSPSMTKGQKDKQGRWFMITLLSPQEHKTLSSHPHHSKEEGWKRSPKHEWGWGRILPALRYTYFSNE